MLEKNKEMYQIIKTKSSELAVNQIDLVKNNALLAMKLSYAAI